MRTSSRGGRRTLPLAVSIALIAGCATAPTPPPATPTTPTPTVTATPVVPLTQVVAIALARKATTRFASEGVLEARLTTWGEIDRYTPPDAPPTPAPETQVWIVNLGYVIRPLNGQGVIVVLDAFDGRVLNTSEWIS